MSTPLPAKRAVIDLDHVLERIAAGEYQNKIAAEYGITPSALNQRLRQVPGLAEAKEAGIEQRLDDGLERLEQAVQLLDVAVDKSDLNLARTYQVKIQGAESVLRRLEWRASVEVPNRWSNTSRLSVTHTKSYSDTLRSIDEVQDAVLVHEQDNSQSEP